MTAFIGQAKRLLANCCNRDLPRRSIRYLFASVAATVLTASAFAQASPDWKTVEAAAKKEGTVSLYHNLRPSGIEKLLSEFRKTYPGIKTEHMRLGSAPLIERFSTEFTAGRNLADVVITFPDETMLKGVDTGGWALEWTPPELAAFKPEDNRGNKMFAVHTSRNVIIWNKQRVKPADAPKEWADLWDPKWKGKVAMDPPWRSIAVQGLIAYWSQIGLSESAKKLKANDVRFFEGSAGVFQAVLRGDALVGTLADLPLEPGLVDGAPIGFVYPKSGTAINDGYVMVPAKAPHLNAGKLFANWIMSAPGQAVLQEIGGLPGTRPGITPPKFIPATSSLSNVVDSLVISSTAQQAQSINTWREVFGIR
jgi:iron(III) transport system substrate-binding protein